MNGLNLAALLHVILLTFLSESGIMSKHVSIFFHLNTREVPQTPDSFLPQPLSLFPFFSILSSPLPLPAAFG